MKPNFSLDLTQTGLRLTDLSGEEPALVGEVSLDDQDFDSQVADLRNRTAEKSDEPLATRLNIPNSEILYTTIDDPLRPAEPKAPEAPANAGSKDAVKAPDGKPGKAADKPSETDAKKVGNAADAPAPAAEQAAKAAPKPAAIPTTPPLSPEARERACEAAVRAALEGMTPYALDDLAYVWHRKKNGEICIAAVARETLAEAESFATQRGFNPIVFAAAPEPDKYHGTPDFGPTALASQRTAARKAEAKAAAEKAAAEKAAKAKSDAADLPQADTAPSTTTDSADVAKSGSDSPVLNAKTGASGSDAAAQDGAKGEDGAESPRDPVTKPATPSGTLGIATATLPGESDAPAPGVPVRRGFTPLAQSPKPGPDAPKIGLSRPVVPAGGTGKAAHNAPESADALDDVPPMPVSFASRRRNAADAAQIRRPIAATAKAPPLPTAVAAQAKPAPGATPVEGGADKDSRLARLAARFQMPGGETQDIPPPPPRRNGALRTGAAHDPGNTSRPAAPTLRGSASGPSPIPPGGRPRVKPANLLPGSADAAASLTPVTDSAGSPLSPADRADASARMATGRKLNEAEAMTVFGARAKTTKKTGAMPLVIGLVVALLLAVGVWGAFALLGGDDLATDASLDPPDSVLGVVPPETSLIPAPAPLTDPSDTAEAPAATTPPDDTVPRPDTEIAALSDAGADPDAATAGAGTGSAPDSPVGSPGPTAPTAPAPEAQPQSPAAPDPPSRDPLQRALSDPGTQADDTRGRYATTGIWQAAPEEPDAPGLDRLDELYIASVDPSVRTDAAPPAAPRLPEIARPSAIPTPVPPAPPGTTFQLDDRGLVAATPDGALSPDGIRITAGPPPTTPPDRPARPETLAPSPETQPDLPRIRPRDRPDAVAPDREQTALTPAPDTPLSDGSVPVTRAAMIRPLPRAPGLITPDTESPSLQDRAAAAAAGAAAASTATPQAPLSTPIPPQAPATLAALVVKPATPATPAPEADTPAAVEPEAPISPYAVARSRLPKDKPRDFAQIVSRSRTAAPAPQPTVTRVASAASVAQPRIPSKASVARQATMKNAINLGRTNLIGVYGSTSNRRALLRLSSGKFVKVKVGDRIDGGRVASIGQSDLTYTKGGRHLVLSMPKG